MDYAIRANASRDVELTLPLPRRSYAPFRGQLLHDQSAEEIARQISQLPRVVATIIPSDVAKIISGQNLSIHDGHEVETAIVTRNTTPIGMITWRNRAHVSGRVTSIKTAPRGAAPIVEVGETNGSLTILNPSYEIVI